MLDSQPIAEIVTVKLFPSSFMYLWKLLAWCLLCLWNQIQLLLHLFASAHKLQGVQPYELPWCCLPKFSRVVQWHKKIIGLSSFRQEAVWEVLTRIMWHRSGWPRQVAGCRTGQDLCLWMKMLPPPVPPLLRPSLPAHLLHLLLTRRGVPGQAVQRRVFSGLWGPSEPTEGKQEKSGVIKSRLMLKNVKHRDELTAHQNWKESDFINKDWVWSKDTNSQSNMK